MPARTHTHTQEAAASRTAWGSQAPGGATDAGLLFKLEHKQKQSGGSSNCSELISIECLA